MFSTLVQLLSKLSLQVGALQVCRHDECYDVLFCNGQ